MLTQIAFTALLIVAAVAQEAPTPGGSHLFELSYTGPGGDGTRFKLVTDRGGQAVAGSFEASRSKQECFQLCERESRCKGIFFSETGDCSLVNDLVPVHGTKLAGVSYAKKSQLPPEHMSNIVNGPLGSATLKAKLEKESEHDLEVSTGEKSLMQQRIRDARNAEQEAEATFKELDIQDTAKSHMLKQGLKSKTALESTLSDAQVRVHKAREEALTDLVTAKREARQANIDTVDAAIKSCSDTQKAAVEQWYNKRTELREQQQTALRAAEDQLHKSNQAARTRRDEALEKASQLKSEMKAKAVKKRQVRKIEVRRSQQMAIGRSFEAKALAMQVESPANYTDDVHEAYLKVIQEPDQDIVTSLDNQHTEVEVQASKAQKEAAHKAAHDAQVQEEQLESQYAKEMEEADQAGRQAVERANSDLKADLDLAKETARAESTNARTEFDQGMQSATEAKDQALAAAEEKKKTAIKKAKASFETKIASLMESFRLQTGQIDQQYLNKIHQAKLLRQQQHVPLYKQYNSEREQAARDKASTLEQISNQPPLDVPLDDAEAQVQH